MMSGRDRLCHFVIPASMDTNDSSPPQSRPPDYVWIPTMAIEPGMVLAKPLLGGSGVNVVIRLAEGSVITADVIAQLVNKGVECVAVRCEAPNAQAWQSAMASYEARLREIFGGEPAESCRPLFDALLAEGPGTC